MPSTFPIGAHPHSRALRIPRRGCHGAHDAGRPLIGAAKLDLVGDLDSLSDDPRISAADYEPCLGGKHALEPSRMRGASNIGTNLHSRAPTARGHRRLAARDRGDRSAAVRAPSGHIGLFWRLLIPNAAVLSAASIVLMVAPPNGRVLVILSGLASMLAINVVLMRHAFAPLERLSSVMQRVNPLQPGERVTIEGARSEVSTLAETFNEMLERLESERRESGRRAMLAQEAERRRVASDLHDEIGQSLTALVLQLKQASARECPDTAALSELVASAEEILAELRSVARRLRPEALDDLGLRSALLALAARLEETGELSVDVRIAPDLPPLPTEVELVVYRVAQESLTNVLRHANALHAHVELRLESDSLRLEVVDDGCGFDVAAEHSVGGLLGMRERGVLVGGAVTLESRPAEGTRVRLTVPHR
jgi:two-component system sensor histidine kinase UhpB